MAAIDSNHEPPPQTSPNGESDRGSSTAWPHPIDFPNADVVIYDGNCVFCAKQVKNLIRLDGKHRVAFASLHDEFIADQFPDLSYDQMMEQMYIVPSASGQAGYSSKRLGGAAAIRHLTCRLPKLWIFAPLLHIPFTMPIWQWVYMQIANRRYKAASKSGAECDEDGTCELHFKD